MKKRIKKKFINRINMAIREDKLPNETVKTDSNGKITNWSKLSESTKEWLEQG